MKKALLILVAFASLHAFAQQHPRQERMKKMMESTPEQQAEIQTKRLSLALVLDEQQQKEVYKLELAAAQERKARWQERMENRKTGEKPSEEQREAMREMRNENYTAMLGRQIDHQEKMKQILTPEQFEKWHNLKMKQRNRMGMQNRQHENRSPNHKKPKGSQNH